MVGRDPAAPYVPVQAVVVGSVMQFFSAVTSVTMLLHVLDSHLEARVLGRLLEFRNPVTHIFIAAWARKQICLSA